MLTLSVVANIEAARQQLSVFQTREIPFAAAQALTFTAKDIQLEVQREIPTNFTLRRNWIVQGIRIVPATKQTLTSEVYSRDPFMGIQETGGIKQSIHRRVFDYGDYLAVPLDARKSKSDIVRKQDWPENLVNPFVLTARDGRKYLAVHELNQGRRGRQSVRAARGKQRRSTGTRLMYTLVPKADLKKRLFLVETAQRMYAARFNRHFARALEGAGALRVA